MAKPHGNLIKKNKIKLTKNTALYYIITRLKIMKKIKENY